MHQTLQHCLVILILRTRSKTSLPVRYSCIVGFSSPYIPLNLLDHVEPSKDDTGVQSFLDSCGTRVITTSTALYDDEGRILHGASKPVALRPEGNDEFGFVS